MQEERFSLTHSVSKDHYTLDEIQAEFDAIKARLGDEQELQSLLTELSKFELGRFFVKNQGALSGYWTYYVILGYQKLTIKNPLETFLLNKAPAVLATRERFHTFKNILQKSIQSNMTVCSVPCGAMGDLLHLDLPGEVRDVKFVGIDLDATVFEFAQRLKDELKVRHQSEFFKSDAWHLEREAEFDILTSNGLNIYEKSDDRVVQLYKSFYLALKPGGMFLGSHLNTPQAWNADAINQQDAEMAKKIFGTILQATWANFRSTDTTQQQLQEAGFENIEFHWDRQQMFYTFTAIKPG